MKTRKLIYALAGLAAIVISALTTGCGPVRVDPLTQIKPNESAFVIPLQGDTTQQAQLNSVELLQQRMVATKEIVVPQRKRKTGRMPWSYEWVPTVKVITVDRQPITRQFTNTNDAAGASVAAIEVESRDSIGFSLGVNITAMIEEQDAPTFLYYYPGKNLASVIDTNIRGRIQTILSEEFGERDLAACKTDKSMIFTALRDDVIPFFEEFGITITSLGLAEGLTYEDKEIQEAINAAYVAEMEIERKEQEAAAQIHENTRLLSIAVNDRAQAEEFAKAAEARAAQVRVEVEMLRAQALLKFAEKWNGEVPNFLSTGGEGGSNFLLDVGQP